MMKRVKLLVLIGLATARISFAQETFPINGIKDERSDIYALIGAKVHVSWDQSIEGATLLIKKDKVLAVGKNISIPANAIRMDVSGMDIYPSFLDPYSDYGMPEVKKASSFDPQAESNTKGAYNWNQAIKAEFSAAKTFRVDKEKAKSLRKEGFGALVILHKDGIVRGQSALVSLVGKSEQEDILVSSVSMQLSLDKGSSTQNYPTSMMGAIALLRQTYLDAKWYADQKNPGFEDLTLRSFSEGLKLPQVIESTDKLTSLRVDHIGDELGYQYIIMGSGDEYQRLDEIAATAADFILPVSFPKPYDVEDPYAALDIDLEDLRHWERAPANAGMLASKGIDFAFTPAGLKDASEFLPNIRKAIKYGLTKEIALKALTSAPAKMLGLDGQIGSLNKDKYANFLIVKGDLFEEDAVILENWIGGNRFVIQDKETVALNGQYELNVNNEDYGIMNVSGLPTAPKMSIYGKDTLKGSLAFKDGLVTILVQKDSLTKQQLSGYVEGKNLSGMLSKADGDRQKWTAIYKGDTTTSKQKKKEEEIEFSSKMTYPFVAFGWEEKPTTQAMLFTHVTLWTNDDEGILENYDVRIENGKIVAIGQGLSADGAVVIDGSGKHLTSGIIDEHSHIAISKGVNEAGQAVSAEVRVEDVINSEDINIYRQLAGGVTASQLLHGSANPIGGQSALVKLRWGQDPESMKIKDADGFIKFALGENVKQSNWGDRFKERFPQTRMGVEQVFRDGFNRALEYQESWKTYDGLTGKAKRNTTAPRRDLELETLLEIINSQRFVTCHSYIQSEINMLMHVAEDYDFRINTFTHILEGYKVADKMKAHGVGASTFSDWWAYKFEVREAIPYNATLMSGQGVVTAINSDDAEMGRRLNQEAAKSLKYGGMSEEDAWKMVTLNPAKLLHLDDKMGSVTVGKDADLVLWSGHPLSIYSKAEKTMVDGIVYFDIEKDKELQQEIQLERAALIQKLLAEKKSGAKTVPVSKKEEKLYHCDDIDFHFN
ncbi:amidohydrolase family protein [Reichenbachiella agarivorans]|uniref:Amidohydrolase family protein n=1 Tax=Reichenbachiella agarivorans TaxID=2979464 RepID=A0ABY6CX06_9BACT|nr:amidohydrolase family protein [Reichenbachiella agarivorans]UXP33928.1 amidohydrolase family protein [Reichenbachiella agarivorans]